MSPEIILDTLQASHQSGKTGRRSGKRSCRLAKTADGLDGRAIRKAILAGSACDIETAQNLQQAHRAQMRWPFAVRGAQKAADK